jgi:Peptidase A4 family
MKLTGKRRLAAVLASACLLGTGSAAAASQGAASWPSGIAHPSGSCAAGQTLVTPISGSTDALGVSHFSYKGHPGMIANVAPKSLDASRVTTAMLADLGMPTDARSRQSAVKDAVNLGQKQVAPAFCETVLTPEQARQRLWSGASQKATGAATGRTAVYNTHVDGNWAGYGVTEAQYGSPIESADGTWNVGTVNIPTSLTPSGESTWVGIGGGLDGESNGIGLIQAGTSMNTGNGFRAWWEYVGTSGGVAEQDVTRVAAGDTVASLVDWQTTSSACFVFTDFTNSAGSFNVCRTVNVPYDHTSAEWVNEWPSPYYTQGYYQDPGLIYFSDQKLSAGFNASGPWKPSFATAFTGLVLVTPGTSPSVNVVCTAGNGVVSFGSSANDPNGGAGSSVIYPCAYQNYE